MPRQPVLAVCAAPLALMACNPAETTPEPTDGATSVTEVEADTVTPTPEATVAPPIASGEPAPTASPTDDATDACGASKVRGRWMNALPSAEAKAAIAAAVGDRRIRYYTEGDPITMDYSEDRLNVVLGKDGRIKELRCG